MKFRLDIENKILIPSMILAILPITILGIVSYWNGYQLLIQDRTAAQEAFLGETMVYLESVEAQTGSQSLTREQAQETAEAYLAKIGREDLTVLGEGGDILIEGQEISPAMLEKAKAGGTFEDGDYRYFSQVFSPWGWTVVVSMNKSIFLEELISIQKYTLLLMIIFLVLSMQSIIFTSHNISRPIQAFAQVCKRIEGGEKRVKVDIKRRDEIGILANAFNHMIDQINASTDKLIEMTKLNEDILKNIEIGIMTTGKEGEILTINQAGKDMISKYKDAWIMEELTAQTGRTLAEKTNYERMATLDDGSGNLVYLDIVTNLIRKEDGSDYGAICSFNDITARKVLENNMVRMDRLASVGQFAAGLAHEIRNPLTGIKTGFQVIRNRERNRQDPANIALIEGLTYEIDRINALVTDLLDFSKPKQTFFEPEPIMELLQKSLDLAKDRIQMGGIAVGILEECHDCAVFVDKAQTEQIFLNLITNAVEAMEEGGHLNITVDDLWEGGRSWVRVRIEDDGPGMDEELLHKAFNPFFTTKAKGTGLGLVVVEKLVQDNNGRITVKSEVGKGTTMSVMLPQYEEGNP